MDNNSTFWLGYKIKGNFVKEQITYLIDRKLFNHANISGRYMIENKFYYYRMWCKIHGKYKISLPDLADKQNWEEDTKKYKIEHEDGTLDEIAIEKTNEGYFGRIYRTKPKYQHYGKNKGDSKIVDLNTNVELVGEKGKDITYFAFLPYNTNDLLFLTEVHSGNRGMTIIKEFFKNLVPQDTHEIKSEPLKTRKLLDLMKYAPKELKKIIITFKREPITPAGVKLPVEEIMKRLKIEEDYQIIIGAKIRVQKKNKRVLSTLDNAFSTIFGKSLSKAIDEGIDFPEILSSVDVAFNDQNSKTWDILKDYEREMIRLQKGNLNDTEIKKELFAKLKTKLKEVKENG